MSNTIGYQRFLSWSLIYPRMWVDTIVDRWGDIHTTVYDTRDCWEIKI